MECDVEGQASISGSVGISRDSVSSGLSLRPGSSRWTALSQWLAPVANTIRRWTTRALLPADVREVLAWNDARDGAVVFLTTDEDEPDLAAIPWELLVDHFQNSTLVRLRPRVVDTLQPTPAIDEPARILLVSIGSDSDPSIEKEVADLKRLFAEYRVEFEWIDDPSPEQLSRVVSNRKPHIVHLVAFAEWNRETEVLEFPGRDEPGGLRMMSEFLDSLTRCAELRLLVLNSCDIGYAQKQIGERLGGVPTTGWFGEVYGEVARQFARVLYRELLEGRTILQALRVYGEHRRHVDLSSSVSHPAVWVASGEDLSRCFSSVPDDLPAAVPEIDDDEWDDDDGFYDQDDAAEGDAAEGDGEESAAAGSGAWDRDDEGVRTSIPLSRGPRLARAPAASPEPAPVRIPELHLDTVESMCPALLKNGSSPITGLHVEGVSGGRVAEIRVVLDAGLGSSVWEATYPVDVLRVGLPVTDLNGIQFPILFELIERGLDRRYTNLRVSVSIDGELCLRKTERILFLGPWEWLDTDETRPYVSSYVVPHCAAVRELVSGATEILQIITEDPARTFTGYRAGFGPDPNGVHARLRVDAQIRSFYQLLQSKLNVSYISPPGSGVRLPVTPEAGADDEAVAPARRVGQRVRFPDELVRYRRGTCHDLALVFAACAEHVGIRPVLVLVNGHTAFGYWRSEAAHRRFFSRPRERMRDPKPHDGWTILRKRPLVELIDDEDPDMRLVETVHVTGEHDFAEACSAGGRVLRGTLDGVFDVHESRGYVESMYPAQWTRRDGD